MNEVASRRPGRPPDREKREAILAATRNLLAAHGLDFSMEQVASGAGVSRQTVYNAYPSREALIRAIVDQALDAVSAPMMAHSDSGSLAETLAAFAERYLETVAAPDRIGMVRAVTSAEAVARGYGEALYNIGPRRLRQRLSDLLEREAAAGTLTVDDPALAADLFFSMVAGTRQLRLLLGVADPPGLQDMGMRVRMAVRMFLAGLDADPGRLPPA